MEKKKRRGSVLALHHHQLSLQRGESAKGTVHAEGARKLAEYVMA